jgi:hypothetical protein
MSEQFVNPEESKVENATLSDESAAKKIEHVAEKAAEKASKTVQKYDQNHTIISH